MAVKASVTITISKYRDCDSITGYYKVQASTAAAPAIPTTLNPSGWSTAEPSYTSGSTNTLYYTDCYLFSDGTFQYTDDGNGKAVKSSSYEAAKEAYNKAQATQENLNNLKIGGTNIISNLSSNWQSGNWKAVDQGVQTYIESYNNRISLKEPISVEPNTEYYVKLYSSKNAHVLFRLLDENKNFIGSKIGMTDSLWECPNNCYYICVTIYDNSVLDDLINGTTKIKIEKGNKPTDWSPSQEDIDYTISSVNKSISEVIVGTQTTTTAAWTGNASFDTLEDGRQITYWLPQTSAANATLNLTLSDGSTTGAIPLYYQGTTRLGTQYPAGSVVHLTYRENVTIGTTTIAKGWWGDANYNTNDVDRIRFNNAIKAKTAISASRLIVGDDDGYFHLLAGVTFKIDKPILWANANIAVNKTGTDNYISRPSLTMRNNTNSSWVATQYKTLYLVGILNGDTFTVDSTTPFTTDVPIIEDGKYYISLGYMYSTYQIYLYPEHPIFKYVNGSFKNISQIAYEAQENLDSLEIGSKNYIKDTSNNWSDWWIPEDTSTPHNNRTIDIYRLYFRDINIKAGDTISMQIEIETSDFEEVSGQTTKLYSQGAVNGGWSGDYYFVNPWNKVIDISGISNFNNIQKFIKQYTFAQEDIDKIEAYGNDANMKMSLRSDYANQNAKIRWRCLKIEKGDKCTDWTPAPEDIENKLDTNIEVINNNIDEKYSNAMAQIAILNNIIANLVTDANGASLMTQTASGWTFNMASILGNLNSLSSAVNDLENADAATQSLISNLDSLSTELSRKTAYIDITIENNNPVMILGQTESNFKVKITNETIDFMEGANRIAYVNNNTFYSIKSISEKELQVGNGPGFVWKLRDNKNLGLSYIPVEGDGINLYIIATSVDGWIQGNSDTIAAQGSVCKEKTSDYISVSPGDNIMFQNWVTLTFDAGASDMGLWMAMQFYDASKNRYGDRMVKRTYDTTSGVDKYECMDVTIPKGVKYIRVSARMYNNGKIKVEKGDIATSYSLSPEDS